MRDLGGYAAGSRTVRWRHIYRSAALDSITAGDTAVLVERGIRAICDLRSGAERITAPNSWVHSTSIELWGHEATETIGDSRQLLHNCLVNEQQTREAMVRVYREMPFGQATAYAQIFKRLVVGKTPLLFHCAAGKDRSGVAAALLLSALGVSPETVLRDYMLSSESHDRIRATFISDERHSAATLDTAQSWMPLTEVDPVYLAAMFDEVMGRCGGVECYIEQYLGIGADGVAKLRANLLE